MTTAPDYAAAIEGWRAWRIKDTPHGNRLASIHFDGGWVPGEPLVADCQQRRRSWRHPLAGLPTDHDAPTLDCTCGVYAASTRGEAAWYASALAPLSIQDGVVYAIGRVLLWGAVVEHKRGWRGARAYPRQISIGTIGNVALERLTEVACGLAEYGVPVEIVDWEVRPRRAWETAV